MRNVLFFAFLLAAILYALRKGGGPERAMGAIAASIVLADLLLHQMLPPEFTSLDVGHLVIDLFAAAATFLLAMVAHRFWPIVAAALHFLPLLAHSSRAVDVSVHPIAYLSMQVAASWLIPPLLIAATWRHQRRLKSNGNEPSWHASWRPPYPPTPTA